MIEVALGSENIRDMIPLDSANTSSSGQPCERDENVARQCHNVAVFVYKRGLILRFLQGP